MFLLRLKTEQGVACSFEFGQIDLKILSGDETVYDGSKCQRDRTSATLLLVPGDTWNGGLSWDGGLYSGCTPRDGNSDGVTDPAPAGTYRVQLMLDGKTVGDERVFTITQPAPATTRGDACAFRISAVAGRVAAGRTRISSCVLPADDSRCRH